VQRSAFDTRQFAIRSFVAFVVFCGIVTVAAVWTILPWGGADQQVRDALPAAQGLTTDEVGAKGN
jgi:hypothetical protein